MPEANKSNSRVLDHVDRIEVPAAAFDKPANEYWSLSYLAEGMSFLNQQVVPWERMVRQRLTDDFKGKGMVEKCCLGGNPPEFRGVPIALIECSFQWYAISACQYVRTVGTIAHNHDSIRPTSLKYLESVIPKVKAFRDKVAAHFAWNSPNKKDNDADRIASVIPQIVYLNWRFVAGSWNVSVSNENQQLTSEKMSWSLTEVHECLCERYWPRSLV